MVGVGHYHGHATWANYNKTAALKNAAAACQQGELFYNMISM